MTRFLAMPVCNVATAQILFDALARELQSRDIPWSNMIGFASNTASVMVGARNSVLSRLQSEQPKLFSEIKPLRVLKHCTTRWLSLQRCVKRLLEQWPALFAYFDRQIDIVASNDRLQRIASQLKDPKVKLFCHFVAYPMKPLNNFCMAFQTHASRIGTHRSDIYPLLKVYMSNF